MENTDTGIVLGAIKYKHAGRIVKVYTLQKGLQTFYITVGSKNKSVSSYLQPLKLLDFTYKKSSKSNLPYLKDLSAALPLTQLYTDIVKTSIGFFIAEVLNQTLMEETGNQSLFEFLRDWIKKLDEEKEENLYVIRFLKAYTQHLGIQPLLNQGQFFNFAAGTWQSNFDSVECFDHQQSDLFKKCFVLVDQRLSNGERILLLDLFVLYYRYQIPGFKQPKSLEVIREIFKP